MSKFAIAVSNGDDVKLEVITATTWMNALMKHSSINEEPNVIAPAFAEAKDIDDAKRIGSDLDLLVDIVPLVPEYIPVEVSKSDDETRSDAEPGEANVG